MLELKVISKKKTDVVTTESLHQQIDIMVQDTQLVEHVNHLSNNKLVTELKEHIDLIGGEQLRKSYGKRKTLIIITLLAGAAVASIGSVTFLVVAKEFPEKFANFADFHISDDVSNGLGKFLGWANVAIEAIFYTWTISGILPPLQPKPRATKTVTGNASFFNYYTSKLISWLPSWGEIGLAIASTLPLTLVSLIDQENDHTKDWIKYSVVSSIALVTLISNKFFLTLTHRQMRSIWTWMWRSSEINANLDADILEQAKQAFLEAAARANEKLKHLSKRELDELTVSLGEIAQTNANLEEAQTPENRWIKLVEFMFSDLSIAPSKIRKIAIILVPALAIFAALSWLGLIATVPNSVEKKLDASKAWQYILMILAGIPLIEIGLSLGGSVGLSLSKIGDGTHSLTVNLTSSIARYLGYIPITLFGLFSFGTNATLTIQQFKSKRVLTWMLLPSATLGIDLINIVSGFKLWNEILVALSTAINANKSLLLKHVEFLQDFYEKTKEATLEEIAEIILILNATIQEKIKQFIPSMKDKVLSEFIEELSTALQLKLANNLEKANKKNPEIGLISSSANREEEKSNKTDFSSFYSWMNPNLKNTSPLENELELKKQQPTPQYKP